MSKKEFALVLEGGGTKGAYQVGVWKALKELDIKVKAISGASIGAINGALILQDDIDKMIELYENIEIEDIMQVSEKINKNKNLFNISNIRKIASEYIENKGIENEPLRKTLIKYVDIEKVYNSDIDFGVIAFSKNNKEAVQIFKDDIKKEELIDYLLASSCFPIFKTQKIDGEEFLDGGLYDNAPVNMLIEKGYKNIIIADINGIGFYKKTVDKNVYIKVISPTEKLGGTFEFNRERIKNNIELGYLDTMKAFNKMQGHIYYFFGDEFAKMLEVFNLQIIHGLENAAKIYKMDRYRPYKFEEFIKELYKHHQATKQKYNALKKEFDIKKIRMLRKNIEEIFNGGMGICFVTDMFLDNPASKKFSYLKNFIEDYIESVQALLELEMYLK